MEALLETIIWVAGYFSILALPGWYVYYIGNRNAKDAKFNLMYENFKAMLYDPSRPINSVSWKVLNVCFTEIEDLKWNEEKTDVLRGEFLKLYETVLNEIEAEFNEMMSTHEFDPAQIFGGE